MKTPANPLTVNVPWPDAGRKLTERDWDVIERAMWAELERKATRRRRSPRAVKGGDA